MTRDINFSADELDIVWCVQQGLARLEELVRKMLDIVDNRVVANLEAVQATLLIELPADR